MSMIPDLTGMQLDSYRLLRRLGSGGFGDVYEATDLRRNERVAVKVLEPIKTQQAIQQFFNEVRALVRLRHAHIISINDFGIDVQYHFPFIVMQYAPNGSLRQKHKRGEQLPLVTVVQYVKQLADTLQYAHDDRFIHRDVKPDNVLLDTDEQLLLSDFGIATSTSSLIVDLNQTVSKNVIGTAYYMAPEQCQGKPEKSSDQYALAIMAYEWLYGYPPFHEGDAINIQYQHTHEPVPSLRGKLPDLSPEVEAVILKALSKKAEERYPDIRTFAQELEKVSSKRPIPIGTRLLIYRGHGDGYSAFAWSPGGKLLATGEVTGLVQVWNTTTGKLFLTCEDCSVAQVDAMAWSPDMTQLISVACDNAMRVWDARSGKLLHCYTSDVEFSRPIALSPDGTRLAFAASWAVQVWEASSGKVLYSVSHTEERFALAWSLDRKWITSGSYKEVQVWDASSGKVLHRYTGHASSVRAVALSPDGKRVASASVNDSAVQVWEASSGNLLYRYTGHTRWVSAVAWSPDGKWVASASVGDSTVQVWEASSGNLLRSYIGHEGEVNVVVWSPDGMRLASASGGKTVQVWDVSSGKELYRYTGHADKVNPVVWSPDGRLIASYSNEEIQVWEASSGKVRHHYTGRSLAWSPSGGKIAFVSQNKVQVWEVKSGQALRTFDCIGFEPVLVTWSPDEKSLASRLVPEVPESRRRMARRLIDESLIKVWDVNSGQLLTIDAGESAFGGNLVWVSKGKYLAYSSWDSLEEASIRVWKTSSGDLLHSYTVLASHEGGVVWSPDGMRLAAYSDKMVHVWDTISGQLLYSYASHLSEVSEIAWSPSGTRLIFVSRSRSRPGFRDEIVQVWEASSGKVLHSYMGHADLVCAVAWSPDGTRLASASIDDSIVQVWKASSGEVLYRYTGHADSVFAVAWSPDGTRIASGSHDKTVQIWQAI